MANERLQIRREILEWAVTRSGQSVDVFAEKYPAYAKWLSGEIMPTLKQLEAFSKKCYIPFGYLFLDEPQLESCPIPMFRSANGNISLNLLDVIKDITAKQDWLDSYLIANGLDTPTYVGRYQNEANPQVVANDIFDILGLPQDWATSRYSVEESLKYLTDLIEDSGTMVVYNSMVGYNAHRPIDVSECRGFTLINEHAPFIFINAKDAKVAQMFTLVHEFAHVLKGYSAGIGDSSDLDTYSEQERFCDKVAALFLLPEFEFRQYWRGDNSDNYSAMVKKFKVSRYTIARRAVELQLISRDRMFELYHAWNNEPIETRINSGHPTFARLALRKTSPTFMVHVNNALNSRQILHLDAYRLCGLKGETYRSIVNSPAFFGL